tara:strand:- start:174 stop:581 length:408 start_codon:yes stop_codon:yes gene_type:complete
METFYLTVLIVATIVLIIILIFIGILLSKGDTNLAYPPSYGICPDYWKYDEEQKKCIIPEYKPDSINLGNMYNETTKSLNDNILNTPGYSYDVSNGLLTQYIDFSNNAWNGICDIKKWTNTNNIVWDGVSNYNNC